MTLLRVLLITIGVVIILNLVGSSNPAVNILVGGAVGLGVGILFFVRGASLEISDEEKLQAIRDMSSEQIVAAFESVADEELAGQLASEPAELRAEVLSKLSSERRDRLTALVAELESARTVSED